MALSKIDGTQLDTTSSNFTMSDLTSSNFYRAGTWTPTFINNSGQEVFNTPSVAAGRYIRLGDLVHANFFIALSSSYSTTANYSANAALKIGGLPFNVGTANEHYPAFACGWYANLNGWSAGYLPFANAEINTKKLNLTYATATTGTNIAQSYFAKNSAQIIMSGTYITEEA